MTTTTNSDIKILEKVVLKLDASIEKLNIILSDINKNIAVHDNKIENMEKETIKVETDIRDIYEKIETLGKEVCAKIDKVEQGIERKLELTIENSNIGHRALHASIDEKMLKLNSRLNDLENWRWFIIGAAGVVGWLVSFVLK